MNSLAYIFILNDCGDDSTTQNESENLAET